MAVVDLGTYGLLAFDYPTEPYNPEIYIYIYIYILIKYLYIKKRPPLSIGQTIMLLYHRSITLFFK